MPDSTRADRLVEEFLDQAISSLGPSTRLGSIAGIDRGTISVTILNTSATATIGAVTTARSIVSRLGTALARPDQNSSTQDFGRGDRVALTNNTTVAAFCRSGDGSSGGQTAVIGYQVVEYNA